MTKTYSVQKKYLECWRLRKEFKTDKGLFVAVRDFTLNMAEGEFVSIIGHSGCGKSTVLSMVAGLHDLNGGGMVLDNHEIVGAGPDRAVVFQSPTLLPWLTALENVTLGLEQVQPKVSDAQRAEIAHGWLKASRAEPGDATASWDCESVRFATQNAFARRTLWNVGFVNSTRVAGCSARCLEYASNYHSHGNA